MTLSVSVVIPTHDRPDSLTRAVRSVLDQTTAAAELIVVNDGPQDVADSAEALMAGAKLPTRCLRQNHPSATASRNRGLAEAGGDIILLIDDDIVLPKEYLRRLTELYELDTEKKIGGIGGFYDHPPLRMTQRLWECLLVACGWACWRPRVCAARYVELPAALRGRLRPPKRWLIGGAISLRRSLAAVARFNEAFGGYAFSEDRELTFRIGREHVLMVAPELVVTHEQSPTGRPDMFGMGRLHVRNSLLVAGCVDGGAGTWLLISYDFLGTAALYAAWAVLGRRGGHARYAAGIMAELLDRAKTTASEWMTVQ